MLFEIIKWYNKYVPIKFGQTRLQKIAIRKRSKLLAKSKYGTKFLLKFPRDKSWEKIYFWQDYETGTSQVVFELISKYNKKNIIFFDIGTNIGWYSILAGSTHNNIECHSFEPQPIIYNALLENILQNDLQNIYTNNLALSDTKGESILHTFKQYGHGHSSMNNLSVEDTEQFVIKTVTFDQYVEEKGITNIDIIKLDVEGAELDVLKGATSYLNNQSSTVWIIEMNFETANAFNHEPVEIIDFLSDYQKYTYFRVVGAWGRLVRMGKKNDFKHGDNIICVPNSNTLALNTLEELL